MIFHRHDHMTSSDWMCDQSNRDHNCPDGLWSHVQSAGTKSRTNRTPAPIQVLDVSDRSGQQEEADEELGGETSAGASIQDTRTRRMVRWVWKSWTNVQIAQSTSNIETQQGIIFGHKLKESMWRMVEATRGLWESWPGETRMNSADSAGTTRTGRSPKDTTRWRERRRRPGVVLPFNSLWASLNCHAEASSSRHEGDALLRHFIFDLTLISHLFLHGADVTFRRSRSEICGTTQPRIHLKSFVVQFPALVNW